MGRSDRKQRYETDEADDGTRTMRGDVQQEGFVLDGALSNAIDTPRPQCRYNGRYAGNSNNEVRRLTVGPNGIKGK